MQLQSSFPMGTVIVSSGSRPSVETLLLRAADALENHLARGDARASIQWAHETINGIKAISMLAGIWVEIEAQELLQQSNALGLPGSSLHHSVRAAGRRLQALIGLAELQIGGLRPADSPEELDDVVLADLRLTSWRLVAAVAVQHAFLCLLRRRHALALSRNLRTC